MYQACLKGDWQAVQHIYSRYEGCITAKITKRGDCALHIAAAAEHTHIVEGLVKIIASTQRENLALQNSVGNTALCLAAASGTVPSAQAMLDAYGDLLPPLPMIRGNRGYTPLHMAVMLGHRDMVKLLLPVTNLAVNELPGLLIYTINTELYDVAQSIIEGRPELAIAKDENRETPLHVLARKSRKLPRSRIHFWRRCLNIFDNRFEGLNEKVLHPSALVLVRRLWRSIIETKTESEIEEEQLMGPSWQLLFVADLIWKFDEKNRSIFHVAVQYRQEEIFSLIFQIGAVKNLLAMFLDVDGNSMLHYAAKVCVSGAALQMQRELLWFKVVEELMQPQIAEARNFRNDDQVNPQNVEALNETGKTARELFSEEHKELRKEGEEWMRKTASSCSVVATLVAGVASSAALKDRGSIVNVVGHGALYWLLSISGSLSLISSTASTFMFLAILTSRYAEEDFIRSLPVKLLMGLTLLFFSTKTMMISFTASFSLIFEHGFLWQIVTYILAIIPIIIYGRQLYPIYVEVYKCTIGGNFLFKGRHQLFDQLNPAVQ